MALLDNEGFKILDAVLTDLGRKKLAEGNGNLPVRKYAFGDAEINYGLYDVNSEQASIATILLTPIHEASTDTQTAMKYKLIGNLDKTRAYLPVFQVNTSSDKQWGLAQNSTGSYFVLSNTYASADTTLQYHAQLNGPPNAGIIDGFSPSLATVSMIHVDQGINSTAKGQQGTQIQSDLEETQFKVMIDAKFGRIVSAQGQYADQTNLVNIGMASNYLATYLFLSKSDTDYFGKYPSKGNTNINGPTGKQFVFSIGASDLLLNNTSYMFSTYGSQYASSTGFRHWKIDSLVQVQGESFGSYISIPVTYVASIPT